VRNRLATWALLVSALILAVSCVEALGQASSDLIYQYAVKVVQGDTPGLWSMPPPSDPLGGGLYCTSVNVHNPGPGTASYRVKLAVADHFGAPGPITCFYDRRLGPDEVTQYDGEDFNFMLAAIGEAFAFFEGYFVVESQTELDVVAVYTGSVLYNRALATMETERVPARQIPALPSTSPCCGELALTISTGQALWELVQVPTSSCLTVGPAQPVSYSGWVTPPTGCDWVGDVSSGCPGKGDYYYRYEFCLCKDFSGVDMSFTLWADNDVAEVLLNGNPIYGTPTPPASSPTSMWWFSPTPPAPGYLVHAWSNGQNDYFQPGQNTLVVHVYNYHSVSGLLVSGSIFASLGKCCCPE
jgi:hypothetical protein